jgi:D-tyrosyl-tRNA(Tyr) deacylase
MKALIQRVARACVRVEGRITGEIGAGLLVLLGATHGDAAEDAAWLARKVAGLRVFGDGAGLMNLDVLEAGGTVLVVPQFTLYGEVRRGRRPDFTRAARPEHAEPLFEGFCERLAATGVRVERGVFRAHMEVELVNDGPVTLCIESPARGAAGESSGATGAAAGEAP